MADRLSLIFLVLYSQDNEAEWKARKLNGWKQFLKADFYYVWKGFSVWQTSGGSGIAIEDYYQPVAEDFEIDIRVREWCERTGFEVVSCEGDGDDGGYEPSFRNGRY